MMFFTIVGVIVSVLAAILIALSLLGYIDVETEHTREE